MSALLFVLPVACDKGEPAPADGSKAASADGGKAAPGDANKSPGDANESPGDAGRGEPAKKDPAQTAAKPATPCPEGSVLIPGGKFYMGSDLEDPLLTKARPAHQVVVDPVCIDVHEVTVAEYKTCVGAGECKPALRESWWPQGSSEEKAWIHEKTVHSPLCNDGQPDRLNHPINCLTWAQASAYCTYKSGRLPTEAEWEFAARGSDGRVFPWGDEAPDPERTNACDQRCKTWRDENELTDYGMMFEADDGYAGTAPVGSYPKGRTQGGLEDMVGNVFEWTSDRFYAYSAEPQDNPKGPDEGEARVIRGGAFNSFRSTFADPAFRFSMDETAHTHGIGFRCAYAPTKG